MQQTQTKTIPIISAIILSGIFALLVVVARELSETLTVQQQVYGRSFIAFILARLIYYKHFGHHNSTVVPKRDVYLAIARGVMLYVGAVSLISFAAIHSTVFLTSVLGVLPFATVFGIVFFKEKFTVLRQLSLLLALLGVVVMSRPLDANLQFGIGEWAAIISSLLFSAAYVTRRLHSDKVTNPQISVIMFASGTVGLILLSLLLGQGFIAKEQLTQEIIMWMLLGGVLNVANIMLVNYVFSRLSAIAANILLTAEFVFALIFGLAFYGEVPVLFEIVGTALVVLSIIVLTLNERRTQS